MKKSSNLETELTDNLETELTICDQARSLFILQRKGGGTKSTAPIKGKLIIDYQSCGEILLHALIFLSQSREAVPLKDSWNQELYNGTFYHVSNELFQSQLFRSMTSPFSRDLPRIPESGSINGHRSIFLLREEASDKLVYPAVFRKRGKTFFVYEDNESEPAVTFTPETAGLLIKDLSKAMRSDPKFSNYPGIIFSSFPFDKY